MKWFVVAAFTVCILVPTTSCQQEPSWCYDREICNASTWPINYPQHCNGTRQSPINIVSASARPNDNLTEIHFENYNDTSKIDFIENNDNTVRVKLKEGVNITGGNLSGQYQTVQFHFHWGNGSSVPGSDHTVDGKRYPMELHIVNTKSIYNRNIPQAATDSTGIAALSFFIEVMSDNSTGQPESWRNLTSYLAKITERDNNVSFSSTAAGFSLKDLLGNVSLSKYYRYLGSLTTPNCSEAVVWTVFKEPIKVSKDLIDLFSTTVHFNNSTSQLMTNVYRSLQPAQQVWTQSIKASASTTCFSLGPLLLSFALGWSWS
ncbi:carbonic anhydrase 4-like isoform X1 [Oreochromis niloticus]|uniref:carbonic anhydrase 4-like isoform X1 n=1 Tax=Oreochromis niloticus TaxID=8128 RepID=UPI00039436AB|nr:carbonic anhydrase 4-like isoform X1 [Oreochromis niloticus]